MQFCATIAEWRKGGSYWVTSLSSNIHICLWQYSVTYGLFLFVASGGMFYRTFEFVR